MIMANNNDKKILNVPNLRFPEFTEEWKVERLDEIATLSKGIGISKEQLSNDGEPCILYGELYTKYKSEIIKEIDSRTNIDNSKLKRSKANDVIIPCSGETAVDIATARCVPFDNILLGGDLNVISLYQYDGAFMSYQLNGKRKYDIAKVAQGVSVVHLYGEHLKAISTYNPCLQEQQKIAKLLSLLDDRIATQTKIIEDLKKLNSAINQIIFCNATLVKIQNLCEVIMGQSPSSSSYNSNNDGLPLIQGNLDIYDGVTISRIYTNEPTKISLQNDLILTVRAPVGIVAKNKMKVCIGRGVCALRNKSAIPTMYIYYALDYSSYKWKQIEQGSTFTSINGDNVKNFVIPLVDDAEYSCAFLSKVDALIKCLIDLHSNYIKQKQYLLSQLFI